MRHVCVFGSSVQVRTHKSLCVLNLSVKTSETELAPEGPHDPREPVMQSQGKVARICMKKSPGVHGLILTHAHTHARAGAHTQSTACAHAHTQSLPRSSGPKCCAAGEGGGEGGKLVVSSTAGGNTDGGREGSQKDSEGEYIHIFQMSEQIKFTVAYQHYHLKLYIIIYNEIIIKQIIIINIIITINNIIHFYFHIQACLSLFCLTFI